MRSRKQKFVWPVIRSGLMISTVLTIGCHPPICIGDWFRTKGDPAGSVYVCNEGPQFTEDHFEIAIRITAEEFDRFYTEEPTVMGDFEGVVAYMLRARYSTGCRKIDDDLWDCCQWPQGWHQGEAIPFMRL